MSIIPHLDYQYSVLGMRFTKKDIVVAFFGILGGFIVAFGFLLWKVPGGYEVIKQFSEEGEVLRALKEDGAIPAEVLFRQADKIKPQSRQEFITDYKNYNMLGSNLADQILLGVQDWETPELRAFAETAKKNREKENVTLERLLAMPESVGK